MSQPRSSSRRDFLKFAGLGSLVFGAGSARALGADGREGGEEYDADIASQ